MHKTSFKLRITHIKGYLRLAQVALHITQK
nr:MAG TPA: hypothetical protein [Caudoviricetes sp.]